MAQKFLEDTLISRFIKRLLRVTPLPTMKCVVDGDFLVKGVCYQYKDDIIRCTTSGKLSEDNYTTLSKDDSSIKTLYNFHSKHVYYDSDTHYHLGMYLRYLRTVTGLNLLPYYNCYDGTISDNVALNTAYTHSEEDNKLQNHLVTAALDYKIYAIPVEFNKLYTLAAECHTNFYIGCAFYDKDVGAVRVRRPLKLDTKYDDVNAPLRKSFKQLTGISYRSPILIDTSFEKIVDKDVFNQYQYFSDSTVDDDKIYQLLTSLEHALYLIVQIPTHVDTSVCLIEGDVRHSNSSVVLNIEKELHESNVFKNLSLLSGNTRDSIAFSDRLSEYLLEHVITSKEESLAKVEYFQTILYKMFLSYPQNATEVMSFDSWLKEYNAKRGVWSNSLYMLAVKYSHDLADKYQLFDQDGNLNRDFEKFAMMKGIR